jgi:hypothetical protein
MVTDFISVCFDNLVEWIVLLNWDVTTYCLDANGMNALGDINQIPIEDSWRERL